MPARSWSRIAIDRRIVLRLLEQFRGDTPELAHPHAGRRVAHQQLPIDEPFRLRIRADDRGGQQNGHGQTFIDRAPRASAISQCPIRIEARSARRARLALPRPAPAPRISQSRNKFQDAEGSLLLAGSVSRRRARTVRATRTARTTTRSSTGHGRGNASRRGSPGRRRAAPCSSGS